MPDEWEKEHGLNANDAADRNLRNAEGYTALEVYLNGLMGELLDDDFTSGITQAVTEKPEISYNSSNNTLTVSENANRRNAESVYNRRQAAGTNAHNICHNTAQQPA